MAEPAPELHAEDPALSAAQRPVAAPWPVRHTWREFAFQLATITAGVLIALSVDGILELRRQRNLVREARAAIGQEIRQNLRDLEGTLPSLEEHRRRLAQALRFADDLIRTGKTDVHELQFGLNLASLNRASWQTAERTGALAYMDYATVRGYAELYDLQQVIVDSQRQLIDQLADLSAIAFGGEGGDPMRSSAKDLEIFRLRVLDATGAVSVHRELAQRLVTAYKEVAAR